MLALGPAENRSDLIRCRDAGFRYSSVFSGIRLFAPLCQMGAARRCSPNGRARFATDKRFRLVLERRGESEWAAVF